jgi:hypothetical protein
MLCAFLTRFILFSVLQLFFLFVQPITFVASILLGTQHKHSCYCTSRITFVAGDGNRRRRVLCILRHHFR